MRIRGRVQGVGYRVFTAEVAQALGLVGFVRNRIDGTVEVSAHGADEAMQRFIEALRQGPLGAEVIEILDETPATRPDSAPIGFIIIDTV